MRKFTRDRDRDGFSYEKVTQMNSSKSKDERKSRRSTEPTATPIPHITKRGMQAYPAYPNSSQANNGLSLSAKISNPLLKIPAFHPSRRTSQDDFSSGSSSRSSRHKSEECPVDKQIWKIRSVTAVGGRDSTEESINSRLRSNRMALSALPTNPDAESRPRSSTREKVRLKKSERDQRASQDSGPRRRIRIQELISDPMEHDSPADRTPNNVIIPREAIVEHIKPMKIRHEKVRPQTTGVRIGGPSEIFVDRNFENQSLESIRNTHSPRIPFDEAVNETIPMKKSAATLPTTRSSTSNSKLKVIGSRYRRSSSTKLSKKPSNDAKHQAYDELPEISCIKCSSLHKRLRTQTQTTKNLQRQNGCLESIITQKRNLVEHLTCQIRGLMKENFQLAKTAGIDPGKETTIPTDSISATNLPGGKLSNQELATSTSAPELAAASGDQESLSDSNFSKSARKTSKTATIGVGTSPRNPPERSSRTTRTINPNDPEQLELYDKQIQRLQNANEILQKRVDKYQKENSKTSRFLTDLLYTLNARGYESITDYEGGVVDLYRCRGDHLLDLKGRDARIRTPVKRMTPQETLLKAVIGQQEKLIQSLFVQLDSRSREVLLGSRLTCDTHSDENNMSAESSGKNAALEGEILALVCLIEGACQRNPDIFHVLQDQALIDRENKHSNGLSANNVVIEAVLDRCQRMLCTGTPPSSPRLRQRGRESSSPRSGTPPPYQTRGSSPRLVTTQNHIRPNIRTSDVTLGLNMNDSDKVPRNRLSSRSSVRDSSTGRWVQQGPGFQRTQSASYSEPTASWSLKHQRQSLTRCQLCSLKFPPNVSLAEVNSHYELHNL